MAEKEQNGRTSEASASTAVQLIRVLIWPAVIVFLIILFEGSISGLIDRLVTAKAKVPGLGDIEITAVAASAAAAGVAVGKQAAEQNQPSTETAVQNIAQTFTPSSEGSQRPLNEGRILWVDDNPSNNISLINAFQSLGVRLFQATSTEQAKQMLRQESYDVIISDMNRPPDSEAGKSLIEYVKQINSRTPIIIYADKWADVHRGEEQSIGAARITNDPSIVYHIALRIIQQPVPATG